MTVRHDKDLLSKIRSSYLWTNEEYAMSRSTPSFEQSQLISSTIVPVEDVNISSPTEIHFNSSKLSPTNPIWSPRYSLEDQSQIQITNNRKRLSIFDYLSTCQISLSTLVFSLLIFILCALTIAIPLIFVFRSSTDLTPSTTTTTTTSTQTTSTTSTTTTPPDTAWIPANYYTPCSQTCITVSTVTPSTLLASYPFDNNVNDASGNGLNGQIINGATFLSGYIRQAIELRNASSQYVLAPYIDLVSRSFTIETWIYPYILNLDINGDSVILTECANTTLDHCLHCTIRGQQLYFGFFDDDLRGITNITAYVWHHVAYVYDFSSNIKTIYLNGYVNAVSTASGLTGSASAYLGTSGNVLIGAWTISNVLHWDGLLDQLTVSNQAKTACEILNDYSLVAYFPFDNTYNDIGPNSMVGTYTSQANSGLSFVSGRVNQALYFNSTNAYFQSCDLYSLGQNQAYSISMWVNPLFRIGTLFHLSSDSTGSGAWCLPMLGFNSNGSIIGQTWIGNTVSLIGPLLPINSWTHLALTYSSTNGLKLYINGGLYSSAVATIFSSSQLIMCATIASSGLGTNCQTGLISMGSYTGGIDEFYIYNRELNEFEICPLAHP